MIRLGWIHMSREVALCNFLPTSSRMVCHAGISRCELR